MNATPGFASPSSRPEVGRICPSGKIGTTRPSSRARRPPASRRVVAVAADGDAAADPAERAEEPEVVKLLGDQEPEEPAGRRLEEHVVDAAGVVADQDRRALARARGRASMTSSRCQKRSRRRSATRGRGPRPGSRPARRRGISSQGARSRAGARTKATQGLMATRSSVEGRAEAVADRAIRGSCPSSIIEPTDSVERPGRRGRTVEVAAQRGGARARRGGRGGPRRRPTRRPGSSARGRRMISWSPSTEQLLLARPAAEVATEGPKFVAAITRRPG